MMRSGRLSRCWIVTVLVWALSPPSTALAYAPPGRTVMVSRGAAPGDSYSWYATISQDGGYVAFWSFASNLVPGDTNGAPDSFVYDRERRTLERVSVNSSGQQASAGGTYPSVSGDGRYVAFSSASPDLVPGKTNLCHPYPPLIASPPSQPCMDVFVRDREAGTTSRISVNSEGAQGDGVSWSPVLSADGRFVAFYSYATNFAADDTNGTWDVFVHDRTTGRTERVSLANDGTEMRRALPLEEIGIFPPAISDDGRFVAFATTATNLVEDDRNAAWDVFVRDRMAMTTERVSVATDGSEAGGTSITPSISGDGRFIAFTSGASNLVPNDGGDGDVFVRDRVAGTTERVTLSSTGPEGSAGGVAPSISADGRFVTFWSESTNLVEGDANATSDAFVYDRVSRSVERVSVSSAGTEGNAGSTDPVVSGDGRFVAFWGIATNLVPGEAGAPADVFLRDRGPGIGVGSLDLSLQGTNLRVEGWARLAGASAASIADPAGDASQLASDLGGDLTGLEVVYRPERGDLLLEWRVDRLPSTGEVLRGHDALIPTVGGVPGVVYRIRFTTADASFQLVGRRAAAQGAAVEIPSFELSRCDPDCAFAASLEGAAGTSGHSVVVSLPLASIGASSGDTLSDVTAETGLEIVRNAVPLPLDALSGGAVAIPRSGLELDVVGADGRPVAHAALQMDGGRFSHWMDLSGLDAGTYDVVARACVGSVCGAAARSLSLA